MHIGRIAIIALACVLVASFSIAATNSGYREEDAADVQDWSSFVGVYPNEKLVRAFTGEKNSDSDLVVEFSARRMAMFIYTPTQAQDTQDDISMSGTVSIDGKPAKSITLLGQVADKVAFFEVNDRALPGIVQEMAQGRQVRFTINPVFGGKPTKLTFSLAGFASAFTRAVGLSQKHFGHRRSVGEYFRIR